MKIRKIFAGMSAAAIMASMLAAMPVSAEEESAVTQVKTDISTGVVSLVTEYEDDAKTKIKTQGMLDGTDVKYTEVYGVEFDLTFTDAAKAKAAHENAEDAVWAGGGLGLNSESTGWEQHEWCLKTDDGEGKPVKEVTGEVVDEEAGTYSFTLLKEEPVFKDTDTYAQVWAQDWGSLPYSVESIKLLDKDGSALIEFVQTPLVAQVGFAAAKNADWANIIAQDWESYTTFKLDEESSITVKAPVKNEDATIEYTSDTALFADNEVESAVWKQDDKGEWYDSGEKAAKTFDFYCWYAAEKTKVTPNLVIFKDKDGETVAEVKLPEDAAEDATLEKVTYADITKSLAEGKALTDIYGVEYKLTAEGEIIADTNGAIVWDGWAKRVKWDLNQEKTEKEADMDGTMYPYVHGTMPKSSPVTVTDPFVFVIDFIDMYATYPNYEATLTGIVLDGKEFDFDADKIRYGNIEDDTGNYRIEIYNVYGDTKEDSPIDLSAFAFTDSMELKFVVSEKEEEPEQPTPAKEDPKKEEPKKEEPKNTTENPKTAATALGLGAIALAGAALVVSKKKD